MNQPCSMEDAANYIKDRVLPPDLEGMIRDLGKLARTRRKRRTINNVVKNLTLEMLASSSTRAGTNVTRRKIILPDGFLRSRWCSVYQALGLLKGPAGFGAFEQAFPAGETFGWTRDVPTQDQSSAEITSANKISPYVTLATV